MRVRTLARHPLSPADEVQRQRPAAGLWIALFGFVLALALAVVRCNVPGVQATERLTDGGFESWSNGSLTEWQATATVSESTDLVVSGHSALMASPGSLTQYQEAMPGATYTFGVWYALKSGTPSKVTVRGTVLSDVDNGSSREASAAPVANAGFQHLEVTVPATATTSQIRVAVIVAGAGPFELYVDNATLDEEAPLPTQAPPTSTPTPTATPTDTPEAPPATLPATVTATKTATPIRTPTEAHPATPTRTARPPTATKAPPTPKQPTAPHTATARPLPTETPAPAPVSGHSSFGGLLYNGDFEEADGDLPAGWSKYGGTLSVSSDPYAGDRAALLGSSTSSTKWLYQVVPVTPGGWYVASGFANVSGAAEAFLRLSWYGSDDGSGSAIDQFDSDVSSAPEWTLLTTGTVEAPDGARSLRVRLMLRPGGDSAVAVTFDNVSLQAASPPAPTPTPTATLPAVDSGTGHSPPVRSETTAVRTATNVAAKTVTTGGAAAAGIDAPHTMSATGFRLSEIMSDPDETGADGTFEWIELMNTSTTTLDTAAWRIGDGKELDTLPAQVVAPGEYLVVGGRSATLPDGVLVVRVADGEIGGGLNNSGDVVRLVSPDGTEADAISYGDDTSVFEPAPPAPGVGATLGARIVESDPDSANWDLTERPTPGRANLFAAPRTVAKAFVSGESEPVVPVATAVSASAPQPTGGASNKLVWIMITLLSIAVVALGTWNARGLIGRWRKKPSDGS
jgi:hypothetical protein